MSLACDGSMFIFSAIRFRRSGMRSVSIISTGNVSPVRVFICNFMGFPTVVPCLSALVSNNPISLLIMLKLLSQLSLQKDKQTAQFFSGNILVKCPRW